MSVVNTLVSALSTPPAARLRNRQAVALAMVVFAALALAFLPPLTALWLVFGSALVALVVAAPLAGVYLLPFAVGFGSLVSLSVHGVNIGPTDVLMGALALAWVTWTSRRMRAEQADGSGAANIRADLRGLATRLRAVARRDPLRVALYGAVLAYLAVVTLSLAVASDRISTLKEIIKWSEVAALIMLAFPLLSGLARIRVFVWCVIAAGTLQALWGLWQWATLGAEAGTGRVYGTFDQPNPFAGYLNVALILAVALLLFSPDKRERWMAGAASVLIVGAEVGARSRGALVGLGAAAVILVVVGWRWERIVALAASVGAVLAAVAWFTHLIPASLEQRLLDQIHPDPATLCNSITAANFSIMARLAYWQAALRMFATHPLLGVGAGNFDAAYPSFVIWCWPDPLGHAHNYYLNAAAETGILGLIAFLALTGLSFVVGYLASQRPSASPTAEIATSQTSAAPTPASTRVTRALRMLVAPLAGEGNARRALALGFFAVMVAIAAQNLTDDLFVHAMELQFALALTVLMRLRVPSRSGA